MSLAALAALGGVTAIWFPSLAFFVFFQGSLPGPETPLGAVLRAPVAEAAVRRELAGTTTADAGRVVHQGLSLPLPAGKLLAVEGRGSTLVLLYPDVEVTVDHLPPRLFAALYLEERRRAGGKANLPGDSALDDGEVLERVVATSPDGFHFGMGSRERCDYAAALLVKMLILAPPGGEGVVSSGPGPVVDSPAQVTARRLKGSDGRTVGLAVVSARDLRIVVARDHGIIAFGARGSVPTEWISAADRWLDTRTSNPEQTRAWCDQVLRSHASADPLRVWAEKVALDTPQKGAPVAPPQSAR